MSFSRAREPRPADSMRRLSGSAVILATGNAGKIREYHQLLAGRAPRVITSAEAGIPAPPETGIDFESNAHLKAAHAMRRSGLTALAEDSGLEVEALDNAPGVYTADWAEGPQGRDYRSAMERVWNLLESRQAPTPRRARFRAVICIVWTDGFSALFKGAVAGQLVWPPCGGSGFGYDPMFLPDGCDKTFGQMTTNEKNAVSHRSRALNELAERCLDG